MTWNLEVEMLEGDAFLVSLTNSTTVSELKTQMAQKTGVPAFQQRLANQSGEMLQESGTLISDSTVTLMMQNCNNPLSILVKNNRGHSTIYEVRLTQSLRGRCPSRSKYRKTNSG
ncbi:hypothetical protein U0070_012193 [Myodes glareolus]|uniref:Ubiquitin-like domain-containing protein n=1 Tax=Myodes glareolus TaxID=447135 RepID=A0AAW0I4K6_MYOGA